MLVRALKVLNYFLSETIGTDIDTAALDQPGDEVGLMAEPGAIGNDEPWNRFVRHITRFDRITSLRQGEMTGSSRSIAVFADFRRLRALRWIFAAAALAAIAMPGAADAGQIRMIRAGTYDGTWNVHFATQAGNCSSNNSIPFAVSGTRVSSAGGGRVTGGISRGGAVSVRISVGASSASGSGRLAGNSGTGRWSGIITGDRCSGSWQATRT